MTHIRVRNAKRGVVLALCCSLGLGAGPGVAQDMAQEGPDPEMQALTTTKETTLARRLIMGSIGANNDIVHDILDGALPMDDLELRGRLQSISAMLYAFPSLYRAAPNPYSEEMEQSDPQHVSLSSEAAWEDFDAMSDLAWESFIKAQEAADAPPDQMLARVEELEGMCESCHDSYRKPFEYFDFDRIEDFVE